MAQHKPTHSQGSKVLVESWYVKGTCDHEGHKVVETSHHRIIPDYTWNFISYCVATYLITECLLCGQHYRKDLGYISEQSTVTKLPAPVELTVYT